jgi:tetratricopeptide (TPR) repeat protein
MTHLAKLPLLLLACAAGAGGGILADALEGRPAQPRADRHADVAPLRDVAARLATLEARVAAYGEATSTPRGAGAFDSRGEVAARDDAAATGARRPAAAGDPGPSAPGAPPHPSEEDGPLAGILGRTFGYREAETFFGRLARDRDSIDGAIARLEKEIAANPRSADLHVALATAYAAKTAFGTPPGPEQGTVWENAGRAYDEAIRLDPEHWQARYGRAFGDSMAPEFVGLRPRAIRQFEELVEIQEKQPKVPEHVEVYVRLGTLLKDAGSVKKARETWQRGLDRFPEDKRLVEALALTEEK